MDVACLLVETGRGDPTLTRGERKAVRIVLFSGVLDRYVGDRWMLHAEQVIGEWWVGLDGHAYLHGPLRFK